jgi:hypothetical protein
MYDDYPALRKERRESENRERPVCPRFYCHAVTDSILKSANENWHFACGLSDCVLGTGMQMLAQRPGVIDQIMANSPLYRSNGQPLSPTNQGGSVVVPH